MEINNFVKGLCESMCPESEVQMRTREKILHYYEQNPPAVKGSTTSGNKLRPVLIKEFSRSAAGIKAPKPKDLRTINALKITIKYLLTKIMLDRSKPFWFIYEFIFDRLRCVRQEIVIQNLKPETTIELLEPIVMFLAYSSYRLCEVPIDHYDPYICHQHLQECLKKLLCCYDEFILDKEENRKKLKNRHTLEALYLILNLGNSDALIRGLQLPKYLHQINGSFTKLCLKMSLMYYANRHYKIIHNIDVLPPILCGVAALKYQIMRREMLLRFVVGYQNKILMVPLEWIAKVLCYLSIGELVADCKYYNCEISADQLNVKFNKSHFSESVDVIKPRRENFADIKFEDVSDNDFCLP